MPLFLDCYQATKSELPRNRTRAQNLGKTILYYWTLICRLEMPYFLDIHKRGSSSSSHPILYRQVLKVM